MSYRISIEYDDASPSHPMGPRMWELLQNFHEHYEGYKVTLFAVPSELRFGKAQTMRHEDFKPWVDAAKEAIKQGWLAFALHGFTHIEKEFENLSYEDATKRVSFGKQIFESIGIPLLPIFKAPNWALGKEAREAVTDAGFQVVDDHYYQWNLKDPLPRPAEFKEEVIIAHGHVQDGDGVDNGIKETSSRIMDLPTDTEFFFLDESLKMRKTYKSTS